MLKKTLQIILLLLNVTTVFSQIQIENVPVVSTDRNWTSTISYNLSGATISKSVNYFDVFGKGTQQQSWDIRTDRIWASEIRYDYFGRPALQSLSAPINNTALFGYKTDFMLSGNSAITMLNYDTAATLFNPPTISSDANTLGWYYHDTNTLDSYQDVTSYPYTRTVYSDLNIGSAKAVLGGNKINGDWLQSYVFTMPMEKTTGSEVFYDNFRDSQVVKTVSRDVHGVESVVFTDTDGNTLGAARSGNNSPSTQVYSDILDNGYVDIHIPLECTECGTGVQFSNLSANNQIRIFDLVTEQIVPTTITAATPTLDLPSGFYRIEDVSNYYGKNINSIAVTPIRVTYAVNYYDLSENKFDLTGRLTQSVQPLKSPAGNGVSSTFQYDSLGELISSTSTDEGASKFKYRRDGQIRFSQNAEQSKQGINRFSYTNYDNLGRPVESGVYTGTEIYYDNTWVPNGGVDLADDILEELDGLPADGRTEQNFTVYDLPDPELQNKLDLCNIPSSEFKQTFLAGNVSNTYTQNPTTSKTWYSYDVFGRVQWIVQEIAGLDCLKTIQYVYDSANGYVTDVVYQKYNAPETFVHNYKYNTAGQLTHVMTSVDNINFTLQAHYNYNESGALIRTELAQDLQGIDYVYNLNGQLKAINSPSLATADDPGQDGTNGFAADVFGIALDYYDGDYTRTNTPKPITTTPQGVNQYNGNIKAARWNTQTPSATQNAYTYLYNKNNWMTQATFGTATNAAVITPNTNNDYLEGNITYDANGNITTLTRNGYTDGAGSNNMDNFQYNYDERVPNRLSYVKDDNDNSVPTRYNDIKDQEKILAYNPALFINEYQPNYIYNDLGQLVYNVQDNVGYEYNASGLVDRIKTNATDDTGDFITLYYNNYNDPSVNDTEKVKWIPTTAKAEIANPQDLLCEVMEGDGYNNGYGMRLLGTQTASTKIRVLPNTFTKIDLDVLVDKFMYKETTVHGLTTPSSLPTDIDPTVKVRLRKADGTLAAPEQVITNKPGEYCSLFDEHLSFSYTSGSEEFLTLEIQTLKAVTPQGSISYAQRVFVDNVQVQAAQSTKVAFYYNERGQRVRKESYLPEGNTNVTYYVRDVTGTPMAVYEGSFGPTIKIDTQNLVENGVYGTGRIGLFKRDQSIEGGYTLYELTDHLGNVRAVIRKVGGAVFSLTNKADYYPFGMPMPNKQITDDNYRYAFQGQEKDGETGMEAFELRLWDGRLGRWLTVDPMGQYNSPYLGMGNNPISRIDSNGGTDSPPTDYVNKSTGEVLHINDGVDITFRVDDTEFAVAKIFADKLQCNFRLSGSNKTLSFTNLYNFEVNKAYNEFFSDIKWSRDATQLGFLDWFKHPNLRETNVQADSGGLEYIEGGAAIKALELGKLGKLINPALKRILPSWKAVAIDMEHIASGHIAGGSRVSSIKTLFPERMTELEVEKVVRTAYKNVHKKLTTQGERVLLRGSAAGLEIEMWLNKTTKTIETAYPIF